MSTISSSFETTQEVFRLLGFDVQTTKAQGPPTVKVVQEDGSTKEVETESKDKPWKDPELLGVTFDLEEFQVKVKETRKKELQDEIKEIIRRKNLHPGHASKLRGKLFFLTSSLFGRVGRAFMKPLSERQYMHGSDNFWGRAKFKDFGKMKPEEQYALNPVLEESLKSWLDILDRGRPRPILEKKEGEADAVFFSDGAGPTEDKPEVKAKVGAVLFGWWRENPAAFGVEVPQYLMDKWLARENQIAMIELFAAVMVLEQWGPELTGKRVIGMIDSECVLDALIKGQSRQDDMQKLIRRFWDIVADHQINLYLDRVSTDSNPSDGMSREGEEEAEALGWEIEPAQFPDWMEDVVVDM
jgi:hypothetical protein